MSKNKKSTDGSRIRSESEKWTELTTLKCIFFFYNVDCTAFKDKTSEAEGCMS